MSKNNPVCNYDFTIWDKDGLLVQTLLKERLQELAKKWCFQLEDAGSGRHYQGRMSLKVKKRIGEFSFFQAHLSRTSTENMGNDFYVSKEETRIDGPWRDDDRYIPRQVREIDALYKWQQNIVDNIHVWDKRTINILYDNHGNIGKSTLVAYLCCKYGKQVSVLPALSSMKDMLGAVMCMPTAKMYLCDMPKGLDKNNQREFFSAIESIKNGHVWDTRYSYKEKWFDCPNIWIFSNSIPDKSLLSKDRWRFWRVEEGELKALRCNTT